jgi:DNA-binding PadR family transcriptional regulator
MNGNVASEWETDGSGPARRIYKLTPQGERHLAEWAEVLEHVSKSMARFVKEAKKAMDEPRAPKTKSA